MTWPDGLDLGIGLSQAQCINMILQHPLFHMKEEALPVCRNYA